MLYHRLNSRIFRIRFDLVSISIPNRGRWTGFHHDFPKASLSSWENQSLSSTMETNACRERIEFSRSSRSIFLDVSEVRKVENLIVVRWLLLECICMNKFLFFFFFRFLDRYVFHLKVHPINFEQCPIDILSKSIFFYTKFFHLVKNILIRVFNIFFYKINENIFTSHEILWKSINHTYIIQAWKGQKSEQ